MDAKDVTFDFEEVPGPGRLTKDLPISLAGGKATLIPRTDGVLAINIQPSYSPWLEGRCLQFSKAGTVAADFSFDIELDKGVKEIECGMRVILHTGTCSVLLFDRQGNLIDAIDPPSKGGQEPYWFNCGSPSTPIKKITMRFRATGYWEIDNLSVG